MVSHIVSITRFELGLFYAGSAEVRGLFRGSLGPEVRTDTSLHTAPDLDVASSSFSLVDHVRNVLLQITMYFGDTHPAKILRSVCSMSWLSTCNTDGFHHRFTPMSVGDRATND